MSLENQNQIDQENSDQDKNESKIGLGALRGVSPADMQRLSMNSPSPRFNLNIVSEKFNLDALDIDSTHLRVLVNTLINNLDSESLNEDGIEIKIYPYSEPEENQN